MNAKTLIPLNIYVFFFHIEKTQGSHGNLLAFGSDKLYLWNVKTQKVCKDFFILFIYPVFNIITLGNRIDDIFLILKRLAVTWVSPLTRVYLLIYLFIASDANFSSLTSRSVSNVVLLPCRTKLIELNSTLARQ